MHPDGRDAFSLRWRQVQPGRCRVRVYPGQEHQQQGQQQPRLKVQHTLPLWTARR